MPIENKDYIFFIVALTKQGKLKEDYVRGKSISMALERFIDEFDLQGQIVDFKFCIYQTEYGD